ncbi:hypothetical protein PVAP13_7NG020051 [Panicum virgatum]|uniref:Uncharacterized protein n=1 Tax=Panicum virgatum TaxID=38727 RepID=A0A8T0PSL9_PANVG|nr:hypothetical protein PVAP13_7NG020051 [Panicum virgatum]
MLAHAPVPPRYGPASHGGHAHTQPAAGLACMRTNQHRPRTRPCLATARTPCLACPRTTLSYPAALASPPSQFGLAGTPRSGHAADSTFRAPVSAHGQPTSPLALRTVPQASPLAAHPSLVKEADVPRPRRRTRAATCAAEPRSTLPFWAARDALVIEGTPPSLDPAAEAVEDEEPLPQGAREPAAAAAWTGRTTRPEAASSPPLEPGGPIRWRKGAARDQSKEEEKRRNGPPVPHRPKNRPRREEEEKKWRWAACTRAGTSVLSRTEPACEPRT